MKATALIITFCAAILSPVHAGTIAVDPTSGIGGLASGYGGLTLGYGFQVTNSSGIVVDGLGFWDDQANGFSFGQTFDVGLWDASTGALLRESVITSSSTLKPSLDTGGGWRVNPVSPLFLPSGTYRVGALMPANAGNNILNDPATFQSAPGINFTGFLRQIGSTNLAMPNIGPPYPSAVWFGPTFTFTPGPPPPTGAFIVPGNYNYQAVNGDGQVNTLVRNTNNPRAYQMQFSAAALGLPVGAKITELRFRQYSGATATFPTNTVNWPDYEVTLAQAAHPVSAMSTTFAANMLAPVLVKSGPLTLSSNSFPVGVNPYPSGSLVVFDTPYVYQGGDLVMLFRHPGSDSAITTFFDGSDAAAPGYGTDFRALSAMTFAATTGTATTVAIAQIVFTYSPNETISRNGTNVVIAVTGGPSGGTYHLLTTTNDTVPASQWTPTASGQFDGTGSFRYTNAITPGVELYRTALP